MNLNLTPRSAKARKRAKLETSATASKVAAGLRAWVDAALDEGADAGDVADALADAAGYAVAAGAGACYEQRHRRAQHLFDTRRRATIRARSA